MSRIHRAVATFLMLTCALAGSIDGSFVICVGANGHVAFERASEGCCDGPVERRGQDLGRAVSAEGSRSEVVNDTAGSCGHCIDTPLISGTGAKGVANRLDLPNRSTIPSVTTVSDPYFSSPWTLQIRSIDFGPQVRFDLAYQRTIVLRC